MKEILSEYGLHCMGIAENGFRELTNSVREVKYRNDDRFGTALEAVGSAKQEKICRCADWYLWKHPAEGDVQIRFDVVAVCRKEIQWIQNAFEYRRAGTWNSRRRR